MLFEFVFPLTCELDVQAIILDEPQGRPTDTVRVRMMGADSGEVRLPINRHYGSAHNSI